MTERTENPHTETGQKQMNAQVYFINNLTSYAF